jgi:hypothetical protein
MKILLFWKALWEDPFGQVDHDNAFQPLHDNGMSIIRRVIRPISAQVVLECADEASILGKEETPCVEDTDTPAGRRVTQLVS